MINPLQGEGLSKVAPHCSEYFTPNLYQVNLWLLELFSVFELQTCCHIALLYASICIHGIRTVHRYTCNVNTGKASTSFSWITELKSETIIKPQEKCSLKSCNFHFTVSCILLQAQNLLYINQRKSCRSEEFL